MMSTTVSLIALMVMFRFGPTAQSTMLGERIDGPSRSLERARGAAERSYSYSFPRSVNGAFGRLLPSDGSNPKMIVWFDYRMRDLIERLISRQRHFAIIACQKDLAELPGIAL
jgi:hypothetical protein